MNSDTIHTLAFTPQDASVLRQLLLKELPAEIHLIHTAGLDSKTKTEKLVALYNDFHTLQDMLSWNAKDEASGRALRQLNTDGVIRLRELINSNIVDDAQVPPAIAHALQTLDRGLSTPFDGSRLAFPIGSEEHPRAQA